MDKRELIKVLSKLISFKTVTGNLEETDKCLDFIKTELKDYNLLIFRKNKYPSLLIGNNKITPKITYDIIFHGHIDVAPENEQNQFKPVIEGNKLYGRGALDMKGAIAVLINLFKKNKIKKNFLFLITSDEEIGGEAGTGYFFKNLGFRSNFFITAEGEKDYLIKVKQKGIVMLKIYAKTEGEHSAYTWRSKNAIEKVFRTYLRIRKLFPENKKDKNHWYSTVNLGKISGGVAVNSIPDYAEIYLDVRFCEPWKSSNDIYKKIKRICDEEDVFLEKKYSTEMMITDKKNKYIFLLNDIAKKILKKRKDLFFNNHGTNDARFANLVAIPSVAFGPVGDNYHAKDEFVYIDSLINFEKIILNFLERI
jgi:succinyl-diaminopimelate desuccinylase